MSGDSSIQTNEAEVVSYLAERLTKYPDFPKPGIMFRFINTS